MKHKILILALLLLQINLYGQLVSDKFSKIDLLLERQSVKGNIVYDDFIKPVSRIDFYKYKNELISKGFELSLKDLLIDKEFNDQIKPEYRFLELKQPFYTFSYFDRQLRLIANPILGINSERIFDNNQITSTWGLYFEGYHNSGIGFHFIFNDNITRKRDYYNDIDFLNKQRRIYTVNDGKRTEYSDSRGSLVFQNSWLLLGIIKENITIGNGENSQLILSNYAPSFPSLFYRLNLSDWLSIYLLHGWLISGISDSTKSYLTELNPRIVEHEKYFAMHAFQFNPLKNLTLRFGETIIYSDRSPYIGYMIPFLFYRSVDHMFTYGSEDSGNNGSFFFDINLSLLKRLKLYSSIFIDELSISNLLKGETDRNQFAYQIGVKLFDLFFNDSRLTLEYTRLLPWVYSNWIPAQTYSNHKALLGHYIGQNSDQIYIKYDKLFKENLFISIEGDYTRNGGFGNVIDQYNKPGEKFLYGEIRTILHLGLRARYDVLSTISGEVQCHYFNVDDDNKIRTKDWQLGENYLISLGINFGLGY